MRKAFQASSLSKERGSGEDWSSTEDQSLSEDRSFGKGQSQCEDISGPTTTTPNIILGPARIRAWEPSGILFEWDNQAEGEDRSEF